MLFEMRRLRLALLLLAACHGPGPDLDSVPLGTWGGDEAGIVVSENEAHVHIRCTLGDLAAPILLDARGAFDAPGTYNVDAFPIDRGIRHPARFTGTTDGSRLVLSVRLTDTGQVFGPVELRLGAPPRMRVACPICRR